MIRQLIVTILVLAVSAQIAAPAFAGGEETYKAKCAMCHPFGGNIMFWRGKSLHTKDLEANNLKTATDLVNYMRRPGPGMTVFDEKKLPDKDAREVAEYIQKKFK